MADEDIKIDTRVTSTLHPQIVRSLPEYADETNRHLLANTEQALELSYKAIAQIHDAREQAEKDPTMNEAARAIAVADFADKLQERATKAVDSAYGVLTKQIAQIEGELSQPVQSHAANSSISKEIRDHVRGLKAEGKSAMSFVRERLNEGDLPSASAVLGAPAYLSGLTKEQQSALLRMYHEKSSPQKVKQLAALKAGVGVLERGGGLILGQVQKAIGADYRKIKMLREANNASKRAFNV